MNLEEIQDLIIAGWKSQTLFTALELGIFDQLSDQAKTVGEFAKDCDIPAVSAKKILTACVALKLLVKEGDKYQNAPISEQFLVSSQPSYLGNVALHIQDIMPLWNNLTDAVKNNSNCWEQSTGLKSDHFTQLYQNPDCFDRFVATMDLYSYQVAEAMVKAFDFGSHKALLDVGGSSGILGKVLLSHLPHLKVTIFDLPDVCDLTDRIIREKYRLEENMNTQRGNFLKDSLPQGFDLIYLGWVLHNWPPEIQTQILTKCYEALHSGGMVVITEALLDENEEGPLLTALLSLDMMVSTDGGGESTGQEYLQRLTGVGFEKVRIETLPTMRDLIIGVKPNT